MEQYNLIELYCIMKQFPELIAL